MPVSQRSAFPGTSEECEFNPWEWWSAFRVTIPTIDFHNPSIHRKAYQVNPETYTTDYIGSMDVYGDNGLMAFFPQLMDEINKAHDDATRSNLAIIAGRVWKEMIGRGVEFK